MQMHANRKHGQTCTACNINSTLSSKAMMFPGASRTKMPRTVLRGKLFWLTHRFAAVNDVITTLLKWQKPQPHHAASSPMLLAMHLVLWSLKDYQF